MGKLGVTLLIFGIGSFILPLFGLQFKLFLLFGGASPVVSIILAIIGVLLLVGEAKARI